MIVVHKTSWNLWAQKIFHAINYVLKLICIYLLLNLRNSSITDIEHSQNYIAFGLPQAHEVI